MTQISTKSDKQFQRYGRLYTQALQAHISRSWTDRQKIFTIDSLTTSLQVRFSNENTSAFALSRLHPLHMVKYSSEEVYNNSKHFQKIYGLDIGGELILWYNLWKEKNLCEQDLKNIQVIDVFKDTNEFPPLIKKYISILSALPCTTATVKRFFSTLRRVKTWLGARQERKGFPDYAS